MVNLYVPTVRGNIIDVKARLEVVKRDRLCFNCLGKHKSAHCNSKNRCRLCHKKKHHSSLCGMDDNPAPQRGTTQPLHASQLVQNATPQPTQLSQPTHNSSTQPISQNLVQPTQAQQSTLNPTSNSFVPTQSVAGYTTTTELLTDATHTLPCLLKTAIATL